MRGTNATTHIEGSGVARSGRRSEIPATQRRPAGRAFGAGAVLLAAVLVVIAAAPAAGAAEADANARAYYESQYYGAPPPPGGSELVYNIQTSLQRLGYDPGPADGLYGQRTSDAISQYQHANRLPVDGRPSPQLLNIMISQGG